MSEMRMVAVPGATSGLAIASEESSSYDKDSLKRPKKTVFPGVPKMLQRRATSWLVPCVLLALALTHGLSNQASAQVVTESVAENGLRVWEFPDDGADRFVLMMLVGSGSRHEEPPGTGVAHLLEHVLLAAGKTRTRAESRAELEAFGASINGFTSHDLTVYYIECGAGSWERAVQWLADQLVAPVFREEELAIEQRIVFEELDSKQLHAGITTIESDLYPNHPLGADVGGDKDGIEDLTLEDLSAFYEKHYHTGNVAIGFAGRVPGEACKQVIRERFADLDFGSRPSNYEAVRPKSVREIYPNASGVSAQMLTGYHLPASSLVDIASQRILTEYLDTRAFELIREEHQLSYSPTFQLEQHADTARLSFVIKVSDGRNLQKVEGLLGEILAELQDPDLVKFDQARAKALSVLTVTDSEELEEAMQLCWWARRLGEKPSALQKSLLDLEPAAASAFAKRNFVSERRFVFANGLVESTGYWGPILALLFVVVAIDFFRGFRWGYAIHDRWQEFRAKRARARTAKRASIVPVRGEELEKSIQEFYEDQDRRS